MKAMKHMIIGTCYYFFQGYKAQNMFLLTQTPMENTIGDFWRMMYDYKASIVVALDDATDTDWVRVENPKSK